MLKKKEKLMLIDDGETKLKTRVSSHCAGLVTCPEQTLHRN